MGPRYSYLDALAGRRTVGQVHQGPHQGYRFRHRVLSQTGSLRSSVLFLVRAQPWPAGRELVKPGGPSPQGGLTGHSRRMAFSKGKLHAGLSFPFAFNHQVPEHKPSRQAMTTSNSMATGRAKMTQLAEVWPLTSDRNTTHGRRRRTETQQSDDAMEDIASPAAVQGLALTTANVSAPDAQAMQLWQCLKQQITRLRN